MEGVVVISVSVCRSCGSEGLATFLSLGLMPLANGLLTRAQLDQPEPRFPLEVAFCAACSLVQITETVPPEQLFRSYAYQSSMSDTIVRSASALAERLIASRRLDPRSLVVEVGSNDGCLLQNYTRGGIPVLGIEPARNIAEIAEQKGVRTLSEFFGPALARRLAAEYGQADIIHANNVFAHIPDLNGAAEAMACLLKPDGRAVIEVPYVKDLIDHVEFDTIYHEHVFYFSLTALVRLFARHALVVADVERIPIHGGTLRLFVGRPEGAVPSGAVRGLLDEEARYGLDVVAFYQDFGHAVEGVRRTLVSQLARLKAEGKRIAAYGASAKGATLLNYCGIGPDTLDFVVDRNPIKQGHYMPGVHVSIRPVAAVLDDMPDYLLLLTWNFAEEIVAQQEEYVRRGGRFILPLGSPVASKAVSQS
jgi:SAM-dependent methyltransferase